MISIISHNSPRTIQYFGSTFWRGEFRDYVGQEIGVVTSTRLDNQFAVVDRLTHVSQYVSARFERCKIGNRDGMVIYAITCGIEIRAYFVVVVFFAV